MKDEKGPAMEQFGGTLQKENRNDRDKHVLGVLKE